MAPEQSAGWLDLIDRRTDVYGLGAILYEILTGTPPFTGDSIEEVLRKVREEEPAAPRQLWAEAPPALEVVCLRALAKQPADRPAAAADLALEVQGWQEYERRKAEEALRESEALYHSLVESLPCFVLCKDLESRFTFANQRLCEMAGRPLDQLLGKTDLDFFPKELVGEVPPGRHAGARDRAGAGRRRAARDPRGREALRAGYENAPVWSRRQGCRHPGDLLGRHRASARRRSSPTSTTCSIRSWIICRTPSSSKTQPAVSSASTRPWLFGSGLTTRRRSSAKPTLTSSRNRTPRATLRTTRRS